MTDTPPEILDTRKEAKEEHPAIGLTGRPPLLLREKVLAPITEASLVFVVHLAFVQSHHHRHHLSSDESSKGGSERFRHWAQSPSLPSFFHSRKPIRYRLFAFHTVYHHNLSSLLFSLHTSPKKRERELIHCTISFQGGYPLFSFSTVFRYSRWLARNRGEDRCANTTVAKPS